MTRKLQYHQFFKLRPKSKLRPRFNRKTGSAFTPKETMKYEKEFADLYKGPLFSDGLLSVKLRFTIDGTELLIERVKPNDNVEQPASKLTGDIDNYAKAVLDALNGVAYADDKQIVCLYLEKA
jgi:Holliday junction resolvase RusA-like endonuclease